LCGGNSLGTTAGKNVAGDCVNVLIAHLTAAGNGGRLCFSFTPRPARPGARLSQPQQPRQPERMGFYGAGGLIHVAAGGTPALRAIGRQFDLRLAQLRAVTRQSDGEPLLSKSGHRPRWLQISFLHFMLELHLWVD
jgi:hypothetical protein